MRELLISDCGLRIGNAIQTAFGHSKSAIIPANQMTCEFAKTIGRYAIWACVAALLIVTVTTAGHYLSDVTTVR